MERNTYEEHCAFMPKIDAFIALKELILNLTGNGIRVVCLTCDDEFGGLCSMLHGEIEDATADYVFAGANEDLTVLNLAQYPLERYPSVPCGKRACFPQKQPCGAVGGKTAAGEAERSHGSASLKHKGPAYKRRPFTRQLYGDVPPGKAEHK